MWENDMFNTNDNNADNSGTNGTGSAPADNVTVVSDQAAERPAEKSAEQTPAPLAGSQNYYRTDLGSQGNNRQTAGSNYYQQGTTYGQAAGYGQTTGQAAGYGQTTGQTAGQATGYGQTSGQNTGYGQQNAWENPYANRYNQQTAGANQYRGTNYTYTDHRFDQAAFSQPAQGQKKKGTGKKVAIGLAIAASITLIITGLYQVSRHIPFSLGTKQEIAQNDQSSAQQGSQAKADDDSNYKKDEKVAEELPAADSNATQGASQKVTTITAPSPVVVTDVTQVVASCMPAIVAIDNNFTQTINYFGQRFTQQSTGSGSGIIVGKSDTELLIVTNYHVIEDSDSLSVQFIDGEKAEAQVRDTTPDMDLAVVSVALSDVSESTMKEIVVATLGDSDALVLGEPVIAIGNALGQGQSVTTGVVSALNREITFSDNSKGTFIQTDAAINPGNSGGALLNSAGELIGINSSKYADTDVEGMGYAIPISAAQSKIDEMMNRELISDDERGYLGITGATVPYEYTGIEGVRVRSVKTGSGAEKAGLQEDDIIIRMNGENIKTMEGLQNKLKYCRHGDSVTVTILRKVDNRYVEVDVNVTLSNAKAAGIGEEEEQQQPSGMPDAGRDQDGDYEGDDEDDEYYYFGGDDQGFPFGFPFFGY